MVALFQENLSKKPPLNQGGFADYELQALAAATAGPKTQKESKQLQSLQSRHQSLGFSCSNRG
jgi:hypothetical protein